MEVAWRLMALKQAAGRAQDNDADRRHLARYAAIRHAPPAALAPRLPPADSSAPQELNLLVARLAAAGFPCLAVDLSHPSFGAPVFKVIAPGLQPAPGAASTRRLCSAAAEPGAYGGVDIPLY